jgi:hypothetical protein
MAVALNCEAGATVNTVRTVQVSNPCKVKRFFFSLKRLHRLWGPPFLLYNGQRGVLLA